MSNPKFTILLAEDSSDDRLFIRRSLEKSDRFTVVGEVSDGQEAIEYLKGEGPFADRSRHPLPDILFLDLKMPRKSGFDVLQWLQEKRDHRMLVFVMSGSRLPTDVDKSQRLGADGYFKKSSDKWEQLETIRVVTQIAEAHFSVRSQSAA